MYYLRMDSGRTVLRDSRWYVLRMGFFSISLPWMVPTNNRVILPRLSHAQELAIDLSIYGRCDVEVRNVESNALEFSMRAPDGVPPLREQFWAWFRVKSFFIENA